MGANDRGYDPGELELEVANYATVSGDFYDVTDDPSHAPTDDDYHRMDWATFQVTYPDGHVELRTLIGPWEDYEEFEASFLDWLENGTP